MSTTSVGLTDAARLIGRSASDVLYLIDRGHLPARRVDERWALELDAVAAYRYEEDRWVSFAAAARLQSRQSSAERLPTIDESATERRSDGLNLQRRPD